jgi:hypothetical protein
MYAVYDFKLRMKTSETHVKLSMQIVPVMFSVFLSMEGEGVTNHTSGYM